MGVLHVRDLLTLDTKRRHTALAETAMEKRVFYIQENASLSHALSAFLSSHYHLLIVINKSHNTVGLITLEDVMEKLLGRKLVDEFDSYDDIRAVASRSLSQQDSVNKPEKN